MRTALNRLRWMAAGSLLLVGGAWAGSIYRSAPAYRGPDPAQLAALAGRLQTGSVATVEVLPDPPVTVVPRRVVPAKAPARVAAAPVIAAPRVNAPVLPPAGPLPTAPPVPTAVPAPIKPPESPVKSLALMGLTHRGQEDTAWLVDLNNLTRETAEVGDRAFGFTVKEIGAETVLLARNGEEFELRLGEKSIPVPAGSQIVADAGSGFGDMGNFGDGGSGRRGRGQGRQSGFSGQGRSFNRSQFGGGRSGGGRSNSFGSTGAAPSFGGSGNSGSSSGFGGNRGNRSSAATGGNRSGGGFSGNSGGGRSFAGGGFGGGNSAMTSQFAAGTTGGSTSNPQTARRRGARLTGDTPALPAPTAIANPQTLRRVGSNSGAAFGQAGTTGTRLGSSNTFSRR